MIITVSKEGYEELIKIAKENPKFEIYPKPDILELVEKMKITREERIQMIKEVLEEELALELPDFHRVKYEIIKGIEHDRHTKKRA